MKTLTKALLIAIVLGSTATASFAAKDIPLNKASVPALTFNRIKVTGNVKIILVQKSEEQIKVDERFDPTKTTIEKSNYTLRINSTEINPVIITVCVKDLQRIDVSGISSVKTKGNFDLKYLQIFLSNSATANINVKTRSLYTVIKGSSALKLSGSANEHTFLANQNATVKMDNFVCRSEKLNNDSIAAISLGNPIVGKLK